MPNPAVDPTALVVPINIAALCVGGPDAQGDEQSGPATTHAPAADFSVLPYIEDGRVHNRGPYLTAAVLADSEAFQGTVPFLAGVHLHWALPDGLAHGVRAAGPDSPVAFPAVPDRWLVTRILQTAATIARDAVPAPQTPAVPDPVTVTLRSWVVESDRLAPAATAPPGLAQPTVPVAPGAGPGFRYLGQAFDLADWTETGPAAERISPLTAVGYGQPSFAALYTESSTVFGFFDTLDDVPDYDPALSTLSYHVAGWYSPGSADPLADGSLDPADNPFRWSYTGAPAPTRLLCSGIVDGVAWDPEHRYLDDSTGPLNVAIGPSTPEALSALLAHALSAKPEAGRAQSPPAGAEQLLNALQFGLLTAHGVDSIADFEDDVHEAGFAALPGGALWSVRTAVPTGGGQGGEVTLPPPLATALNRLNTLQYRLDQAHNRIEAARSRLFTDWCKYLVIAYDADDQVPAELTAALDQVRGYLEAEITGLRDRIRQAGILADQTAGAASALREALPAGLDLSAQQTAARYRRPNDPVLILSGRDVTATTRYGGDGTGSPDGYLACRLDTELVTALSLPAGAVPGSAAVELAATDLPAPADPPAGVPAQAAALLQEAALLAPGTQPIVVAAVAALGGPDNPAALDPTALLALLRLAAADFLSSERPQQASYTGTAPAPLLVSAWTGTPWLPVALEYELELQPVQYVNPRIPLLATGGIPYPPDYITGQFALDPDGVDLVYAGTVLQPSVQLFTGRVVLNPRATVDLAGQIRQFQDAVGTVDPQLAAALKLLAAVPLLSQGLNGTTEAMLMRRVALQLPVADPLAAPPDQAFTAATAAAVGRERTSPLPENSFNPLRAGGLRVLRLRLVDVFGRSKDYPEPAAVPALSVAPPPDLSVPAGTAFLPPRITQPARLLFEWISPADGAAQANPSPAASPVAGWLLTGNLDDSVTLYGADGTPLGLLGLDAQRRRALWTPAPGGPFPPGTPIEQVVEAADRQLAAAATALYAGGSAGYLDPFLAAVRTALATVLPSAFRQDVSTAVLVGRPLVLALARLSLDLLDPVATDQSWGGFANTVLRNLPPSDLGLGSVRFPVALGAPDRLGDGLIGFWPGTQNGQVAYGTFYTAGATAGAGPVRAPVPATVTLTPDSGPVTVALLLDPRGSVRAATGVLPTASVSLPPDQYARAAGGLQAALPVHPLLTGSNTDTVSLARPRGPVGDWGFVTATTDRWIPSSTAEAPAGTATLDYTPQRIVDGWLTFTAPGPDPRRENGTRMTGSYAPPPAAPAQLDVSWRNYDGTATIYLDDGTGGQPNLITLTVTNHVGAPVVLPAGKPVAYGALPPGQSAVYLFLNGLVTAQETAAARFSAAGWASAAFTDSQGLGYLAIAPAQQVALDEGGTLVLTLSDLTAQGDPVDGQVTLAVVGASGLNTEQSEVSVAVQVARRPQPADQSLNLLAGFAGGASLLTGAGRLNSLLLFLTNPADTPLAPGGSASWGPTPPTFRLDFVYGDGPGALTDLQQAAQISVDLGAAYGNVWKPVQRHSQGPAPYWTMQPDPDGGGEILGTGASATVAFDITGLVTTLPAGLTFARLSYSGIPGYDDGFFAFPIRRRDPVQITDFTATPQTVTQASGPVPVVLDFTVAAAGYVVISNTGYAKTVTNPTFTDRVTVQVGETTAFTLTAIDPATGNQTTASATVTVSDPSPTVHTLTVEAGAQVDGGLTGDALTVTGNSKLHWVQADQLTAASVEIDNGQLVVQFNSETKPVALFLNQPSTTAETEGDTKQDTDAQDATTAPPAALNLGGLVAVVPDSHVGLYTTGTIVSKASASPLTALTTAEGPRVVGSPLSAQPELHLSGSGRLTRGTAPIRFDEALAGLVHHTPQSSYKVLLTPSEPCNGLAAAERTQHGFTVVELLGGTSDARFDWLVIARLRTAPGSPHQAVHPARLPDPPARPGN